MNEKKQDNSRRHKSSGQTSLYQRLSDLAGPLLRGRRVDDFVFGLGLTVLRLDDGHIGCALMMREEIKDCLCHEDHRLWIGAAAEDLLEHLNGDADFLLRSLALAAVNAAAPTDTLSGGEEMDSSRSASCSADEDVVLIGLIPNLVDSLRRQARTVTVFDTARKGEEGISPDRDQEEALSRCHRVWATGATMANGSIENLLRWSRRVRSFTLVGPSTPMYAAAFCGTPVTALAGCRWHKDRYRDIFSTCARGGSIFHLRGFMDKLHLGIHP